MNRSTERFKDFCKALNKLKEAMQEEPTEIVIDGTLQRYEFTFELAWKTMKDYLEYMGIIDNLASPRGIIQKAFQANIIEDGETWINMMLDRNSLSHLYDENKSRQIYDNIRNEYIKQFEEFKIFGDNNI